MKLHHICALMVLTACGGCTSVSSTMLNRLDSDDFVGNSNGDPKKHCSTRPFKGIPITLRVPTHVDVAIQEKIRFSLSNNELRRLNTERRHLTVSTDLIYTDKVFTVDVKRPAAGTAKYTLEFGGRDVDMDNSQYFKSIQSKIVDETINDITGAVSSVLGAVQSSTDGGNAPNKEETPDIVFLEHQRTVAWKRFDVDSLDFEIQVADFVSRHMNQCNSCAGNSMFNTTAAPQGNVGPDAAYVPQNPIRQKTVPQTREMAARQSGFVQPAGTPEITQPEITQPIRKWSSRSR